MENSKSLLEKKCIPCEGGVAPLSEAASKALCRALAGWTWGPKHIVKNIEFKDFLHAMAFVNQMAELAESEGHHPDIGIVYNKVSIKLWTHAIGGLSENDFIVAAKIDALLNK